MEPRLLHTLSTKALCKWGHFEQRLNTLKLTQNPWALVSKHSSIETLLMIETIEYVDEIAYLSHQ